MSKPVLNKKNLQQLIKGILLPEGCPSTITMEEHSKVSMQAIEIMAALKDYNMLHPDTQD